MDMTRCSGCPAKTFIAGMYLCSQNFYMLIDLRTSEDLPDFLSTSGFIMDTLNCVTEL